MNSASVHRLRARNWARKAASLSCQQLQSSGDPPRVFACVAHRRAGRGAGSCAAAEGCVAAAILRKRRGRRRHAHSRAGRTEVESRGQRAGDRPAGCAGAGAARCRASPRRARHQRHRHRFPGRHLPARHAVPRLHRFAAARVVRRAGGLPGRHPHERSVRRHRRMGCAPGHRHRQPEPHSRLEPDVRPERTRRRTVDSHEGWFQRRRTTSVVPRRILRALRRRGRGWRPGRTVRLLPRGVAEHGRRAGAITLRRRCGGCSATSAGGARARSSTSASPAPRTT